MPEHELFNPTIPQMPLLYRGIVEDVDDPAKAGRVRIRVLGIHSDNHDYVKTDELPWAIPATSVGLSGGGLRNIGMFKVPDIGSHIAVFFEGGDHNYPVYFAALPAIEYLKNYEEKDGKFKDKQYTYDEQKYRYDDKSNYSETMDEFETVGAKEEIDEEKQVQDWSPQTRKDTFAELETPPSPPFDPPGYKKTEPQEIFPKNFFQKDIRIAFDGKANHDTSGYDGISQTKPSDKLTNLEQMQELDAWSERKWGFNDNDEQHQHAWKGDDKWKPEYPMCSTERNAQGEIKDTDILKERKTYIHPSKYFIELVQLDCSRKKEDFFNERSIKNVYERQRGVGNSPDEASSPELVKISGSSNNANPIKTIGIKWKGRENNKIKYDDIDLKEREQKLQRFEERKHNPGREKTVIEDFVYRYYINKVNETYQVDRNIRIYRGNDNLEIEHGDINQRLHRGSHNMHLDEGNFNRTINKGWYHLHIDEGHHFIELGGRNNFEVSSSPEKEGNPDNCKNQHKETEIPNGADNEGCDAKFNAWTFEEGENECKNQFFLLHNGHQIFRLEKGHQHFQLNSGDQKFWLIKGHQTFHLEEGDQRFQLDDGDIERYVQGSRITFYSKKCCESTSESWQFVAGTFFKILAPKTILDGDVLITGNVQIDGLLKATLADTTVTYADGSAVITKGICESVSAPVER